MLRHEASTHLYKIGSSCMGKQVPVRIRCCIKKQVPDCMYKIDTSGMQHIKASACIYTRVIEVVCNTRIHVPVCTS